MLKRLLIALAAIVGIAATASLGFWQWGRGQQRTALHEAMEARAKAAPVTLPQLLRATPASDELLHRPVAVRGEWIADRTVFLDNRQMNAVPGFYVVTPLRLDGSDAVVLVQRGWVPRNFERREDLPPVQTPAGVVDVRGRLAPPPAKLYAFGTEEKGPIRQNLDLARFRVETGLPLLPLSVQQAGPASEGLLRQWPQAGSGAEKNYGYAFQWWAIAAVIAILYAWFQLVVPAAKHGVLDQPLGLTVHSLPQPQEAALAEEQRTRTGRWKMLLVMLVCAAPVVASYFMYYVVRPEGRRNYGELIDPQRPIPAVTATTLDGKSVSLPSLQGQWLLVSVAGGSCDSHCERRLYLQRQLREGLGKDKDRMDWVWLVADDAPVREELKPALHQATVLRVPAAQLAQWLAPAPGQQLTDHFYVVDPMGHWMMRFPPGEDATSAAKVRKDLERLMRASAGWDKAGR